MPPVAISVNLLPVASNVKSLDAGHLQTRLQANALIMMNLLKERMQQYPADLRNVPIGMHANGAEGRQYASRTARFRGESLSSYRARAYQMYVRTGELRSAWHVVERGFIVQLYNNAREASRRGRGRPYAVFVHGNGDGTMPQAAQHLGRWPSLFEEFQKVKAEFYDGAQRAVQSWVASELG